MRRLRSWSVDITGSADFLASEPAARDQLLAELQKYVGREVRGPRGGRYVLGPIETTSELEEWDRNVVHMTARLRGRYVRPSRRLPSD